MSRLPTPGSDDNTWGDVLNDFLGVSHAADGTIKASVVGSSQIVDGSIVSGDISATAGITKTQLASAVQTSLGLADTALQSVSGATSSVTGGVRLTGDLGGTATAPTTPTAVHLTGNETIAGTKTFTDAVTSFSTFDAPRAGTSDTNYSFGFGGTSISPRTIGLNPLGANAYHDLLAFNKWWGTPTFTTSSNGTTFNSGTLDSNVFAQKDSGTVTLVNGTTNVAARWIWTSGNVAYSAARWWTLAFTYQATAPSLNISLDSSADGSVWTNRFTATGVFASASLFNFVATDWTSDSFLRLTIAVTNSQPITMSAIRAYSARWGDQGGGRELSLPYTWTKDGSIGLNMGTSLPTATLDVNGDIKLNGALSVTGAGSPTAFVTNTASGQYNGSQLKLLNTAATLAGAAGVQMASLISDSGATATTYEIDSVDRTGAYLATVLYIDLASKQVKIYGALDVSSNKIINLATPTNPADAATKAYVDSVAGGGGGITRAINQVTANVTAAAVANKDYVYWWSGSTSYTVTMPTAVANTNRYTLKNSSSIAQPVNTTSSQTIEGGTSITINAGNSVDLISNGANWMVI